MERNVTIDMLCTKGCKGWTQLKADAMKHPISIIIDYKGIYWSSKASVSVQWPNVCNFCHRPYRVRLLVEMEKTHGH